MNRTKSYCLGWFNRAEGQVSTPIFDLLNIHCASIPEYGGLASIHRAIKNDFIQKATLQE